MARITIVGSGVVGQATGKGFVAMGHDVRFVDVNPAIIAKLRGEGYTAAYPADVDWAASDLTMLSVNTPTIGGRIVLDHLLGAVETLASGLAGSDLYHVVVVRSTVPPTTTMEVIKPLLEQRSGRLVGRDLGLCMNPEFLRQVSADQDFLKPWLTIVGSCGVVEATLMDGLYRAFGASIVHVDCTMAETIKYANNLYNATKISFFNEFHVVCERLGIDSEVLGHVIARSAEAMWNPAYGTRGGWAYGGACLPKDTLAFLEFASGLGLEMPVLSGTIRMNEIMELRGAAPASLLEVVPAETLMAEALDVAGHAATTVAGACDLPTPSLVPPLGHADASLAAQPLEVVAD
jgi:UDPglucose 6-dehydrogenase